MKPFHQYLILLFTVLLYRQVAIAQWIPIKLKNTIVFDSTFTPTVRRWQIDDFSKISHDKIKGIKKIIYKIPLNDNQNLFSNQKKGLIPDSILTLIIQKKKLIPKEFIHYDANHEIELLVVVKDKNYFEIIPNTNNNNTFNDDLGYLITIDGQSNAEIHLPNITFDSIDYRIGHHTRFLKITYDIKGNINLSEPARSSLRLIQKTYKTGTLADSTNAYPFIIDLIAAGQDYKYYADINITFGNLDGNKNFAISDKKFYKLKDTIALPSISIVFDSVSVFGEYAYFKPLKKEVNKKLITINEMSGTNLVSNQSEKLFDHSNYKLIDFWATWCKPCLEQHITLKSQYDHLAKKNVTITGILIDKQKNWNLAVRHIQNQKLNWTNYTIQDQDFFKILIFPTYLILSPSNEILFRTGSLSSALNFLNRIDQ